MPTRPATKRTRPFSGTLLSLISIAIQSAAAAEPVSVTPSIAFTALHSSDGRERDIGCLADAIYYEAANQPIEGRRAVAQVVLNRLSNPHYPKSVCGVVYQGAPRRGCQFTFACDGSLARIPALAARKDAETIAEEALDGMLPTTVGESTHYHTLWVRPYWSASLIPTVRIGAHQFYSLPHGAGVYPDRRQASMRGEALLSASPTVPQASRFSVWGLDVAQLSPLAGGVSVTKAGLTP